MTNHAQIEPAETPVPVLIGPTASGKSSLAVRLARRLIDDSRPAEIVNADSMLVYRGMDIGTAKPTLAERGGVRHHLIDIFDLDRTASVADFQQLARAAITDCRDRGVVPVVVGGSALYVRAIVDRFEFPGTDPQLRAALEADLERIGADRLHRRLADRDPGAAASILPGNGRRIVRALEVIELTGRPYSASLPEPQYAIDGVIEIGLDLPRPVLDERIEARVDQMWADGFVDEVRRLEQRGLRNGLTASRALGYRQILQYLAGELDEQQARQRTITQTRKFARRQDGWFRRDPRITWLDGMADDLVDRALPLVAS
ncbi:tRNA (adenosine(37)-N6)-dimethylallyltransferase MiaA [Microlunatus soli]|uniref:tRNA (adenosine(37)-N6)-dimethylallyltransferase MiaA n=1 Tax=Microlunatus soli TaxID=630515 RepID=UPI001E59E3E2|nr:tRNA (adenosine(37)-N6)-dimethylallyltransferase MiaA [Microlunatus soli]